MLFRFVLIKLHNNSISWIIVKKTVVVKLWHLLG